MQSSLRSVLYVIPSGPGADFLLDLLRTLLISRGLMGALLKCVKSALVDTFCEKKLEWTGKYSKLGDHSLP